MTTTTPPVYDTQLRRLQARVLRQWEREHRRGVLCDRQTGEAIAYKILSLDPDSTILTSPSRDTPWTGPVLSADAWDEAIALAPVAPGIHCLMRRPTVASPRARWICVRVRASGSIVLGEYEDRHCKGRRADRWRIWGLRAQRVTVDRIDLPASLAEFAAPLAERYQCPIRIRAMPEPAHV